MDFGPGTSLQLSILKSDHKNKQNACSMFFMSFIDRWPSPSCETCESNLSSQFDSTETHCVNLT